MEVIQIYKPLQDRSTKIEDLELVSFETRTTDDFKNPGKIVTVVHKKVPYWCVRTENIKVGDTYHQWLKKKEEEIKGEKFVGKGVEGIYLYDIIPIGGIVGKDMKPTGEVSLMVRYDYIRKYE